MAKMIKKQSLVDQVYAKLREDIITSGGIPLGTKLNVNEMQNDLGVSCTPIREAINRLQQEGLVIYENNVGARVLTLDEHDVEEIQQLALTLHRAAIRLAIEKGDRKKISEDLEKDLVAYRAARTVREEATAVNRFLGVFYHNCGNRRLDQSMLAIQGQQLLLRHLYADSVEERAADASYFQQMYDGARKGSSDAICSALTAYTDKMTAIVRQSNYVRH
ncbi:MAG: GntR family transcriptional regulator [Clostridia bacterium]|nr:GntR family transcriptional regulator [Clostridia bacterium]